ncbi:hypothetical protein GCM10011345_29850 [Gemmobacter megaterium]|nr:hypothetical protein GCM10011345_29850 [Gemmobacter megaterium]
MGFRMAGQDQDNDPSVEFALAEIARECEDAFSPLLRDRGVHLEVAIAMGAGRRRKGDPFRLREVLDLLLANPDPSGNVRLFFSGRPERPLTVEVSGVQPPPVRAIELVGLMKGLIDQTPSGAAKLTLPFGTVDASDTGRSAVRAKAVDAPFSGLQLLIADDSPTNLMVIREMLANTGASITAVSDGAQVVETWRTAQLDMLLLDIAMPVMDGLSALRAIRAEEDQLGRPHIPAVAVTANALKHQLDEYIMGGFDTHIAKPFRRQELISTIEALRPHP